ncbi:MAG TPA: hypothetical protein VKA67_03340, partial [Verrucomicrobiae bacterium]|nr:hypothetical protein [Verrucomicrobiae bacterium]
GHTDCQVCKATALQLLEKLKNLGVDRSRLPENLNEYFGLFASESQNVIKACDIVRHSPLIGSKIPVHGLMVDLETGQLEWVVNGYDTLQLVPGVTDFMKTVGPTMDAFNLSKGFNIGEMKFPEARIGETVTRAEDFLTQQIGKIGVTPSKIQSVSEKLQTAANVAEQVAEFAEKHWPTAKEEVKKSPIPPKIPAPPPIRPRANLPPGKRP